MLKINSSLY